MESIVPIFAPVNTLRYGGGMDDKLNRDHWLSAGLQALAVEGAEGLRIMSIAQQLGVTKGSFYWHFQNLDDYQSALLDEWEQRHTQQIIHYVEGRGGDALSKLRNLMSVTVSADARLAQAIRSWANTNPKVKKALARVDQARLGYLVGLLSAFGWPTDKAETLARWSYCALIGHFSLQGPPIVAEQIKLILEVLTPKPVSTRKK
jgi:AcrR family transcriptional regulator